MERDSKNRLKLKRWNVTKDLALSTNALKIFRNGLAQFRCVQWPSLQEQGHLTTRQGKPNVRRGGAEVRPRQKIRTEPN